MDRYKLKHGKKVLSAACAVSSSDRWSHVLCVGGGAGGGATLMQNYFHFYKFNTTLLLLPLLKVIILEIHLFQTSKWEQLEFTVRNRLTQNLFRKFAYQETHFFGIADFRRRKKLNIIFNHFNHLNRHFCGHNDCGISVINFFYLFEKDEQQRANGCYFDSLNMVMMGGRSREAL